MTHLLPSHRTVTQNLKKSVRPKVLPVTNRGLSQSNNRRNVTKKKPTKRAKQRKNRRPRTRQQLNELSKVATNDSLNDQRHQIIEQSNDSPDIEEDTKSQIEQKELKQMSNRYENIPNNSFWDSTDKESVEDRHKSMDDIDKELSDRRKRPYF